MKNGKIFIMILAALIAAAALILVFGRQLGGEDHWAHAVKDSYYCPMHPSYTADKPGDCPICNMRLVKKEAAREIEKKPMTPEEICLLHNCPMKNCSMRITGNAKDCPFCGAHLNKGKEKKILYYRNPMNPQVTSPVPMKDPMGMDYAAVYSEENSVEIPGVYISPERQQLIGVKKEKVEKRPLTQQILTVGRVAYDPELFVVQQEYLQAVKMARELLSSQDVLVKEQATAMVEASRKKLLLKGMSPGEITELAEKGVPQEYLYLPLEQDQVWVYLTIYEYEMGLVKAGLPVEVQAVAFPGEKFGGEIVSITPILDPATRSVQARAQIENKEHKLKPDMYVNVEIHIDLGEKLAVSREAVMDTGERTMVFVAMPNGYFVSRQVKLGHLAGGYHEVLAGLDEGEEVVSSGNFFVDSESRLKSAIGETQDNE